MSGKVIARPPREHGCAPGWTYSLLPADDPMAGTHRAAHPPAVHDYPAGTVWRCDCGQHWVSTGPDPWKLGPGWRRERWWERRRRVEEAVMTDEFAVVGHDEHGHPQVRYLLDPSEVTVIRDPERGDEVIGYVWEPADPVPSPIVPASRDLMAGELEDFKRRFEAAMAAGPKLELLRDPPADRSWLEMERREVLRVWSRLMWTGIGVAVVALVWLYLVLFFGSSQALALPAIVGLAGALLTGVGVFGPDVERHRRRRGSR